MKASWVSSYFDKRNQIQIAKYLRNNNNENYLSEPIEYKQNTAQTKV